MMVEEKIDVEKILKEKKDKDRANGISDSGSSFYRPIDYKVNPDNGLMEPIFGDPIDLDEQIQLAKSQVDIDVIMKRWRAGDTSVLNVKPCYYGDISQIPNDINSVNDQAKDVEKMFIKLNPELKALFGNNVNGLASAIKDGSFNSIVKTYYDSKKPKEQPKEQPKEEVK